MSKFRFEKTSFGWRAYAYSKEQHAYIYFGHFYTQREAREVYLDMSEA